MSRLNTLTLVTTLIVALLSALLYKHNHQFLDTTLTTETTTQLLKASGLSASFLDSVLSKVHTTPTSKDMSAASRTIRKVFLAADQVLAKITPNVSVWAVDPEGDPLGDHFWPRPFISLRNSLKKLIN